MGINRIRLQAGSPAEMAAAQEAAAQNPELDKIRQQLFGEGYVQDIGEGKGIAQYYSGFGLPPSLTFTPAPVEEVAPVADVIEPVVETGGGGGGTGNVDITTPDVGDAPINLDTPLTQMITTPDGDTMTVKEAMTTDDAYSLDPLSFDNQFEDIESVQQAYGTPINVGFGEGQVDPGLAAGLEGPIIDTSPITPTITAPSGDVFAVNDPLAAEKIDFQTPEKTNAIVDAFNSVKNQGLDGLNTLKNKLSDLGGIIKENTVEIGGKTIDLTKSLVGGVISLVSGIPGVGLLLNALPEDSIENRTTRGVVDELKAENDYGFNMQSGNLNQDPFGRNPVSMFGNYEQALMDDLNYEGDNKFNKSKKDFAQDYFDKKAEFAGGVEVDEGTVFGSGEFLPEGEDLVTAEELAAEEEARAEAAAIEQAAAQRAMQEQIAAAEAAAAQTAREQRQSNMERDSSPSGEGAGAGGGSQQATSGGGFSSGFGGGWGWSKGGIVSLKNGKR